MMVEMIRGADDLSFKSVCIGATRGDLGRCIKAMGIDCVDIGLYRDVERNKAKVRACDVYLTTRDVYAARYDSYARDLENAGQIKVYEFGEYLQMLRNQRTAGCIEYVQVESIYFSTENIFVISDDPNLKTALVRKGYHVINNPEDKGFDVFKRMCKADVFAVHIKDKHTESTATQYGYAYGRVELKKAKYINSTSCIKLLSEECPEFMEDGSIRYSNGELYRNAAEVFKAVVNGWKIGRRW